MQDDLGLANTLQSRGDLFKSKGQKLENYTAAKDSYLKALDLYIKVQEAVGLCYTLAELYECECCLGNKENAEEIKREALAAIESLPYEDVKAYVKGKLSAEYPIIRK